MTTPSDDLPAVPADHVRAEAGPGRTLLVAVVVAAVVAATGLFTGWLWATVSPRLAVVKGGDGSFYYADAEPEQAVAADGWFLIIGIVAGIVFAVLAWALLRRYRGSLVLVALVVGALGAAWLAWWWGVRLGHAEFVAARAAAQVGARVDAPLTLRITDLDRADPWRPVLTGVVAVPALATAFTYACLAGWSRFASLRGPDPMPTRPDTPLIEGESVDDSEDQFGPGRAGSSEMGTGTALT